MSECKALGRSTPKVPLRAGRAPGRANGRNGKAPDYQTLSMLHSLFQKHSNRHNIHKIVGLNDNIYTSIVAVIRLNTRHTIKGDLILGK